MTAVPKEPSLFIKECVQDILPHKLSIVDANRSETPKMKGKGCTFYIFDSFSLSDMETLHSYKDINLFVLFDKRMGCALMGNNLRDTPKVVLQTGFIC